VLGFVKPITTKKSIIIFETSKRSPIHQPTLTDFYTRYNTTPPHHHCHQLRLSQYHQTNYHYKPHLPPMQSQSPNRDQLDDQITIIPSQWHGTPGQLLRCCLPLSKSLDSNGTAYQKLQKTAREFEEMKKSNGEKMKEEGKENECENKRVCCGGSCDLNLVVVAIVDDDEVASLTGGGIKNIDDYYRDKGIIYYRATWLLKYSKENQVLLGDLTYTLIGHLKNGDTVAAHCHSGFEQGGIVIAAILGRLNENEPSDTIITKLKSVDPRFLEEAESRRWVDEYLLLAKE